MSIDPNLNSKLLDFQVLFNSSELLDLAPTQVFNKANKFKKIAPAYLAQQFPNQPPKKIAVISSLSAQHQTNLLHLFLTYEGIPAEVYEADFNSLHAEVLNPNSELYHFQPDYLCIFTDYRDLNDCPPLFTPLAEIQAYTQQKAQSYLQLWSVIQQRMPSCQVFQSLFVTPLERQLGNLESNYVFSKQSILQLVNLNLIQEKPAGVALLDFEYLAAKIGKTKWFDETSYFVSKQPYAIEGMIEVSKHLSKLIAAYQGKVRKCLVLDLDNTLWGGVIGDDGLDNIILDPHHPLGEAFIAFQTYVKRLKERGIILAICSKNTEAIALEAIENHPYMVLKKNDFAAIECNWDTKDQNIIKIAQQLNIGLDSLVFFDDNPVERGLIKKACPGVKVIDLPEDPAFYIQSLENAMAFEWPQLSADDLNRASAYASNEQRQTARVAALDYDSYLKSLDLDAKIERLSEKNLARFTQLINKSNQFNLRTKRYTEAQIQALLKSEKHVLFYVHLSDCFHQYGIISCIILENTQPNTWFIDTWVMSCRALKLGVEALVFNTICTLLQTKKASLLQGEYLATPKNGLVEDLLPSFGFTTLSENNNDLTYQLSLSDFSQKNHFIKCEEL